MPLLAGASGSPSSPNDLVDEPSCVSNGMSKIRSGKKRNADTRVSLYAAAAAYSAALLLLMIYFAPDLA